MHEPEFLNGMLHSQGWRRPPLAGGHSDFADALAPLFVPFRVRHVEFSSGSAFDDTAINSIRSTGIGFAEGSKP